MRHTAVFSLMMMFLLSIACHITSTKPGRTEQMKDFPAALQPLIKNAVGPILLSREGSQIAVVWKEAHGNKAAAHLYLGDMKGQGKTFSDFTHGNPQALYLHDNHVKVLSTVSRVESESMDVRIVDESKHISSGPSLLYGNHHYTFDQTGRAFIDGKSI